MISLCCFWQRSWLSVVEFTVIAKSHVPGSDVMWHWLAQGKVRVIFIIHVITIYHKGKLLRTSWDRTLLSCALATIPGHLIPYQWYIFSTFHLPGGGTIPPCTYIVLWPCWRDITGSHCLGVGSCTSPSRVTHAKVSTTKLTAIYLMIWGAKRTQEVRVTFPNRHVHEVPSCGSPSTCESSAHTIHEGSGSRDVEQGFGSPVSTHSK